MDDFTELLAAERRFRDELRQLIADLFATLASGQDDEFRAVFQPLLAILDAADAADDAVAAELLAQVDLDGWRPIGE